MKNRNQDWRAGTPEWAPIWEHDDLLKHIVVWSQRWELWRFSGSDGRAAFVLLSFPMEESPDKKGFTPQYTEFYATEAEALDAWQQMWWDLC